MKRKKPKQWSGIPKGYIECRDQKWRNVMAAEGIRPKLLDNRWAYWPLWAVHAPSITALRRAKKSPILRRRIRAAARMGDGVNR